MPGPTAGEGMVAVDACVGSGSRHERSVGPGRPLLTSRRPSWVRRCAGCESPWGFPGEEGPGPHRREVGRPFAPLPDVVTLSLRSGGTRGRVPMSAHPTARGWTELLRVEPRRCAPCLALRRALIPLHEQPAAARGPRHRPVRARRRLAVEGLPRWSESLDLDRAATRQCIQADQRDRNSEPSKGLSAESYARWIPPRARPSRGAARP
jgi:hypothetical protein